MNNIIDAREKTTAITGSLILSLAIALSIYYIKLPLIPKEKTKYIKLQIVEYNEPKLKPITKPQPHKQIKKSTKHIERKPIEKPQPKLEKPNIKQVKNNITTPTPIPAPPKPIKEEPKKQVQPQLQPQIKNMPKISLSSSQPTKPTPSNPPVNLLDAYLSRIQVLIEEHKRYPREAKRFGVQGRVLLKVYISKDGYIESVYVVRSSGSYILDNAAKELIASLRKVPPPPGKKALSFIVGINYHLDDGD